MLTTLAARIREQDGDVWRIATRSAPVAVQPVLAAAIGIGWLVGRLPLDNVYLMAAATSILAAVVSLVIGAVLLRGESPRRRGIGLAVGGSGLAVLVGGLVFGLIFLPLLEPS